MLLSPLVRKAALVCLIAGFPACAGADGEDEEIQGDVGDPCELEEHCADGLICDLHGDQGSCQEGHDH